VKESFTVAQLFLFDRDTAPTDPAGGADLSISLRALYKCS